MPARRWFHWVLAVAAGLAAAWAYWVYWLTPKAASLLDHLLVPAYLAALFSGLAYGGLGFATARLKHLHPRAPVAGAFLALLGALAFAVALPLRPPLLVSLVPLASAAPTRGPAAPRVHHLEVIAIGSQNAASHSTEVWLRGLDFPDGARAAVTDFQLGPGWQLRDGIPMSPGQPAGSLRWDGPTTGDAQLRLLAHDWSGWVEVRWDSAGQTLDLYRPEATEVVVPLPYTGTLAVPSYGRVQIAALAAAVFSLAAVLYIAGGVLATLIMSRFRSGPRRASGSPGPSPA